MRYSELMELFDGRTEWKTVTDSQNGKSFSFTINDVPFLVIFRRTSKFIKGKHIWFWSPSFDIMGRDEDDLYKLTGDGDSVAILSTVVDIMRHVVKKENIPNIIFTADDGDGVRSSLYKRMATTLTRGSEYKVVTEQEPGVTVIMLLNTKTQQELTEDVVVEAPKAAAARFYKEPYSSEKELIHYASNAFGGHPFIKRKQSETSAFDFKYYIKGTNTVVGRSTPDGKFYLAQNPNNPDFKQEKSVVDKATKQPQKPSVSVKDVAMYIWDLMQRGPNGRYADFRDDTQEGARFSIPGETPKDPNTYEISARHWGEWEFPRDAEYDQEDDGDYDWEVMTDKSQADLSTIIKDARNRYPDFNIRVQTGEKNWVYVEVTPK